MRVPSYKTIISFRYFVSIRRISSQSCVRSCPRMNSSPWKARSRTWRRLVPHTLTQTCESYWLYTGYFSSSTHVQRALKCVPVWLHTWGPCKQSTHIASYELVSFIGVHTPLSACRWQCLNSVISRLRIGVLCSIYILLTVTPTQRLRTLLQALFWAWWTGCATCWAANTHPKHPKHTYYLIKFITILLMLAATDGRNIQYIVNE